MRRALIFLVLFGIGAKYGIEYLLSPKFTAWADQSKQTWTCEFDNSLAHFHVVMSKYDEAIERFQYAAQRCDKTSRGATATFGIAQCVEKKGDLRQALNMYQAFLEKYPTSEHAHTAMRALQVINAN